MTSRRNLTELARMELYNIALTNAKAEDRINRALVAIGFSNEMLETGIELYDLASRAFYDVKQVRIKSKEAHTVYIEQAKTFSELYFVDRKIAKMVFINDDSARNKLDLGSGFEQSRLKQFEQASVFYLNLSKHPDLLDPLPKPQFTAESIAKRLELLSEVHKARNRYHIEKSNSSYATIAKNDAMRTLSKWMTQFFSIAREALKHEPDMIKALGVDGKK